MSKIHGMGHTPINNIWRGIRQRCCNPNDDGYKNYGGRGISVCPEWLDKENGFINFYNDVSKLPHFGEKGYSINRIDNDGNYEPGNVEWSTQTEQANNRRTSRYLTYNNETHTMAEWAKIKEIPYKTLHKRLKDDWPLEEALEIPIGGRFCGKKIFYNGKKQTLAQWAKELGVSWSTLWSRIYKYNWPLEKALTKDFYTGNNQYTNKTP